MMKRLKEIFFTKDYTLFSVVVTFMGTDLMLHRHYISGFLIVALGVMTSAIVTAPLIDEEEDF